MTHTPGEWEMFDNGLGIGVTSPDADVAHCHGFHSGRSKSEVLANARLIAAAPDLLEALETVVQELAEIYRAVADTKASAQERIDTEPSLVAARAAIAKARGETA